MKTTSRQLKQIIKEELQALMEQARHPEYESPWRRAGTTQDRPQTTTQPRGQRSTQIQRERERATRQQPRREYDTDLDWGQFGRDVTQFVPWAGEAADQYDVATGEMSPGEYVAGKVPVLGTALDVASTLGTLSRPVRAQMQRRADREFAAAQASPASQPQTAASRPPPRAMGAADTLSGERSQRAVGGTAGAQAAWKRDEIPYLYTERVQRMIRETLQNVLTEHGFKKQ